MGVAVVGKEKRTLPTLKYATAGAPSAGAIELDTGDTEGRRTPGERLVVAETVVPKTLEAVAKQQLEDELYDLHRRIFRGVDKAAFVKYVVDSAAEHTWIQLYRGEDGALGGYLAVHIYERKIAGRMTAIVRGETGTLRRYRGANLVGGFFADRVLRYRVAHPLRPLYLLGALVHPSSYAQLARYAGGVWPREGVEMPAEIRGLMEALGEAFGLERVDPGNALVREVGWQTIDSRGDRAYWERCERPGVQFFRRENPGYEEGHGLLTLVPLTLGTVTRGIARYLYAMSERRGRKLAARGRAGLAALLPAAVAAAAVVS